MRIILYTGKGGVGKTSIAAAAACKLAKNGKKTLIMSTDQAHSLRDSFEMKLSSEPIQITENLFAMEINLMVDNEKLWGHVKQYIEKLVLLKSDKSLANEELLIFPGFEEILALVKIKEIEKSGEYDVLVVDCAPTGETMSLLKSPEMFKWAMEKVLPVKKKAVKVLKPVIETTTKIPMPSPEVFDEIETIYRKLEELHLLLMDQEKTSLRIVTTPEKIVVKEAKRNFSYLHLFQFNVDQIIINKVFPKEAKEGYFNQWWDMQQESIAEINTSFAPIPIAQVPLLEDELKGITHLEMAGASLYEDTDPYAVLWKDKIFEIKQNAEGYELHIHVPFVNKKELDLLQKGEDIIISIKNEKRSITLPQKLQSKTIKRAQYSGQGYLVIEFNS